MNAQKHTTRKLIFHPLLFAIYPILALLAMNLDQVRAETALRAGLLSLAFGLALYGGLRLLLRDTGRAALLASGWLLLFFTYGHVYQMVEGQALAGFVYGKHRFLAVFWLLLALFGLWLVVKKIRSGGEVNTILNLVSVVLVLFPLFQIAQFEFRMLRVESAAAEEKAAVQGAAQPGGQVSASVEPDIYYIVLDGYSRSDVMQELYDLDINPFLEELRGMGFVIPDCAQSNYGLTAFSMFASLNMDYLDAYGNSFPLGSERNKVDYQQMRDYLRDSRVRAYLQARGYQMITFETGFWWLNVDNSDLYIVENNNPLKQYSSSYNVSNFEELYLRTTALRVLSEANAAFLSPLTNRVKPAAEQHYEWVRFALDQLDKTPEIPGKKFVYFHVLAPHDPFVLGPDGEYNHPGNESDIPGYPNGVKYLNKRLVEIARNIIAQSETPPIIIIQGDHGWDPRYRMEILNAYFLPDGGGELIYPTITPVNTFRVVLDRYFGGNFGLLEDKSYFSVGGDFPAYGIVARPYQLTPVPNTCVR